MSAHPDRKCCGGAAGPWCGKAATVVVALVDYEPAGGGPRWAKGPALCWFACDDPAHHSGGTTQPIADWFRDNVGAS